ncbi:arsenic transporter, partial [Campylobacter jejuni]|nr:arsenic transporter [Campylobacter jejuni]EHW1561154.1 arsenic transporter [Campylobacter jejuni]
MLAFFIFLSTLVLLFWRPWNLPIWVFSSLGAFFVFIFQLVDFKDAFFVFSLVWDSSLTLVGLIILSFSLEALGFFDFIASKILYFSREKNQEKIYISTKKMMLFLLIFVF